MSSDGWVPLYTHTCAEGRGGERRLETMENKTKETENR